MAISVFPCVPVWPSALNVSVLLPSSRLKLLMVEELFTSTWRLFPPSITDWTFSCSPMLTPPPISVAPFTCRVLTAVLNAERSLSNSVAGAIYIADIHLASVWITTIFTFDATPAFVHSTVISDAATPLTCLLPVNGSRQVSGVAASEITVECTNAGVASKVKMVVIQTDARWISAMYMAPATEFDSDLSAFNTAVSTLQVNGATDIGGGGVNIGLQL